MKTNFVKMMLLPLVAFSLASAAAVSTSEAKVSKTAKPIITGYIHSPLPSSCKAVAVDCDVIGNAFCMSGTSQVFDKESETTCTTPLLRTVNP
ncbi:MAG: hypothetical protein K2P85_11525 [Flavobacteriaceae bacterium]|nr:hypothetical protein [Flavobacteriaceae bacterium]